MKRLEEIFKHPVTTQVFAHMRKMDCPVGVREIQKILNLGSSSTSHYHLNKLVTLGIARKNKDNSYELVEPFISIREIPLPVILNHYLIYGNYFPNIILLVIFLGIIIIALVVMIVLQQIVATAFTGFLTTIVSFILLLRYLRTSERKH